MGRLAGLGDKLTGGWISYADCTVAHNTLCLDVALHSCLDGIVSLLPLSLRMTSLWWNPKAFFPVLGFFGRNRVCLAGNSRRSQGMCDVGEVSKLHADIQGE